MNIKASLIAGILFLSISAHAQLLWVEGGLDILRDVQEGRIYYQQPGAVSTYVTTQDIRRDVAHLGITIQGFYPINFGTYSFEKFATGPVSGFSITRGQKKLSYDPAYGPQEGTLFRNGLNVRVPLLWSIRFGDMLNQKKGNLGCEFAAGMQVMHLSTADERGFSILPAVRVMGSYKRFSMGLNIWLMRYKSVYSVNGERFDRLAHTIFSIEFKYSMDFLLE